MGSIPSRGDVILNIFFLSLLLPGIEAKSVAFSCATQHAIPPEFGGKWTAECLNFGFPMPASFEIPLKAGYLRF